MTPAVRGGEKIVRGREAGTPNDRRTYSLHLFSLRTVLAGQVHRAAPPNAAKFQSPETFPGLLHRLTGR
jgi:hypothetical protein